MEVLEQQNKELRVHCQSIKVQGTEELRQYQIEIAAQGQRNNESAKEIQQLQKKIREQEATIKKHSTYVSDLKLEREKNITLEGDLRSLQTKLADSAIDIKQLSTGMNTQKRSIDDYQKVAELSRRNILKLEEQIKGLESKLEIANSSKETLQKKKEDVQGRFDKIKDSKRLVEEDGNMLKLQNLRLEGIVSEHERSSNVPVRTGANGPVNNVNNSVAISQHDQGQGRQMTGQTRASDEPQHSPRDSRTPRTPQSNKKRRRSSSRSPSGIRCYERPKCKFELIFGISTVQKVSHPHSELWPRNKTDYLSICD